MKKGVAIVITSFLILGIGLYLPASAQTYQATGGASQHNQRLEHRRYARGQGGSSWWDNYTALSKQLEQKLQLQAGVDVSYSLQRASAGGKQTAIQGVYYPFIQWQLFNSEGFGRGVVNANYTLVHYWGTSGAVLQSRIGAGVGFNDGLTQAETFSQFTYTHTLPGRWSWLSVTAGQFSVGNFDSTSYLGNQQTSLMNASFAQNLSSAYPSASLGAYVEASYKGWTLSAGYQDGTNLSGQTIRFHQAFSGKYTLFTALNRTFEDGAFYNLLYYYQPLVSGETEEANGLSLSLQQPLSRQWLVFARANYASSGPAAASRSLAFGAGWQNPLGRNPQDVILLGLAFNRLNQQAFDSPLQHKHENVLEVQWVWNITPWVSLTPDFQLYPKTAQKGRRFTAAAGLRTTIML